MSNNPSNNKTNVEDLSVEEFFKTYGATELIDGLKIETLYKQIKNRLMMDFVIGQNGHTGTILLDQNHSAEMIYKEKLGK